MKLWNKLLDSLEVSNEHARIRPMDEEYPPHDPDNVLDDDEEMMEVYS